MTRCSFLIILCVCITSFCLAQTGDEEVTTISLKAIAGMQYDLTRFTVKPGEKVRLVLTNTDEMSHNLVITSPAHREEVVKAALDLGDKGPGMNYIPHSSAVLWSIALVEPAQTKTLEFQAPEKSGIYPYVCTFPGHGFVMFGAMYVTTGPLPPLESDPNLPPTRHRDSSSVHALHPYHPVPPYLYRILMPDSGPAAIAVSLPGGISYCWDAGACRLRYAWQGDFIDPQDYWNKKGEHFAKILGTVFYRDKTKFPLREGDAWKIPSVDFKGYRLVNAYPEFHYTINGLDVYEMIQSKKDDIGLERTFRIAAGKNSIWFSFDVHDGVVYSCNKGKWSRGQLGLSPIEAKEFTIVMTKQ